MSVKKRIPLDALQKGMYDILVANMETPVYDNVPEGAALPYITFGLFTAKPNGGKVTDISDVSITLLIWSYQEGKTEVNTIAEEIIAVFGENKPDLIAADFKLMSLEFDMFEAFPEEEDGYRAAVTFIAKIQNIRSES